jgi:hypothetical protein
MPNKLNRNPSSRSTFKPAFHNNKTVISINLKFASKQGYYTTIYASSSETTPRVNLRLNKNTKPETLLAGRRSRHSHPSTHPSTLSLTKHPPNHSLPMQKKKKNKYIKKKRPKFAPITQKTRSKTINSNTRVIFFFFLFDRPGVLGRGGLFTDHRWLGLRRRCGWCAAAALDAPYRAAGALEEVLVACDAVLGDDDGAVLALLLLGRGPG